MHVYLNVKQGHANRGHVCFLAQINKESFSSCLSENAKLFVCGFLYLKSHSLLFSTNALIPLSAYWWCLLMGWVVCWQRWNWISWWLSLFSTNTGIAKAADVLNLVEIHRRPEQVQNDKCALPATHTAGFTVRKRHYANTRSLWLIIYSTELKALQG